MKQTGVLKDFVYKVFLSEICGGSKPPPYNYTYIPVYSNFVHTIGRLS